MDNEKEIWKPAKGYEDCYEISNLGNVKSIPRMVKNGRGVHLSKERILKGIRDKDGYLRVRLYNNAGGRIFSVHRLVAEHFIENPQGYKEVNHKNELKTDNRASNLEWCDNAYNIRYGTGIQRCSITRSKPVIQMDKNGNKIAVFYGIREASRQTGCAAECIRKCCHNVGHTAGGYKWKFR